MPNNCLTELGKFPGYCSLVIFREVFFASESHSNILSGEYPLITVSVSFCAII